MRQITFNLSSDLDPAVLGDGRIVFSRWDNVANINQHQPVHQPIRTAPLTSLLYGVHSHDTGPGRRHR
jgi:hypothetical protein